jgi:DNA-binding MarR family transcriptional regulator
MLRALILDRYDYRQKVADALGMSFFRAKALRLLVDAPMTMRELATALATDAPYMTLLVNDLEDRKLVRRGVTEHDRRVKVVTITRAGRDAARTATEILMTPPRPMSDLADEDFASLERIVLLLNEDAPVTRQ